MIHEEIVTYEVAKLAKEKGFPQDVFGTCEMKSSCYLEDGRYYKDGCIYPIENAYTAPTQSLLRRWLREEKRVIVYLFPMYMRWYWGVKIVDTEFWYNVADKPHDAFATYEEAMEVGLKYALEIIV